jgi:hypothetical protein
MIDWMNAFTSTPSQTPAYKPTRVGRMREETIAISMSSLDAFYFFSLLNSLLVLQALHWREMKRVDISVLFLIWDENLFTSEYNVRCGFWHVTFIVFKYILSRTNFLGDFCHERMLKFVKCFFKCWICQMSLLRWPCSFFSAWVVLQLGLRASRF